MSATNPGPNSALYNLAGLQEKLKKQKEYTLELMQKANSLSKSNQIVASSSSSHPRVETVIIPPAAAPSPPPPPPTISPQASSPLVASPRKPAASFSPTSKIEKNKASPVKDQAVASPSPSPVSPPLPAAHQQIESKKKLIEKKKQPISRPNSANSSRSYASIHVVGGGGNPIKKQIPHSSSSLNKNPKQMEDPQSVETSFSSSSSSSSSAIPKPHPQPQPHPHPQAPTISVPSVSIDFINNDLQALQTMLKSNDISENQLKSFVKLLMETENYQKQRQQQQQQQQLQNQQNQQQTSISQSAAAALKKPKRPTSAQSTSSALLRSRSQEKALKKTVNNMMNPLSNSHLIPASSSSSNQQQQATNNNNNEKNEKKIQEKIQDAQTQSIRLEKLIQDKNAKEMLLRMSKESKEEEIKSKIRAIQADAERMTRDLRSHEEELDSLASRLSEQRKAVDPVIQFKREKREALASHYGQAISSLTQEMEQNQKTLDLSPHIERETEEEVTNLKADIRAKEKLLLQKHREISSKRERQQQLVQSLAFLDFLSIPSKQIRTNLKKMTMLEISEIESCSKWNRFRKQFSNETEIAEFLVRDREQIEQFSAKKASYAKNRSELQEEVESLTQELQSRDEESEQLRLSFNRKKEEDEDRIASLKPKIEYLKTERKTLAENVGELKNELKELEKSKKETDTAASTRLETFHQTLDLVEREMRNFESIWEEKLAQLKTEKEKLEKEFQLDFMKIEDNEEEKERESESGEEEEQESSEKKQHEAEKSTKISKSKQLITRIAELKEEIQKHTFSKEIKLQLIEKWRQQVVLENETESRKENEQKNSLEIQIQEIGKEIAQMEAKIDQSALDQARMEEEIGFKEVDIKRRVLSERQRLTAYAEYVSLVEESINKLFEEKRELEEQWDEEYRKEGERQALHQAFLSQVIRQDQSIASFILSSHTFQALDSASTASSSSSSSNSSSAASNSSAILDDDSAIPHTGTTSEKIAFFFRFLLKMRENRAACEKIRQELTKSGVLSLNRGSDGDEQNNQPETQQQQPEQQQLDSESIQQIQEQKRLRRGLEETQWEIDRILTEIEATSTALKAQEAALASLKDKLQSIKDERERILSKLAKSRESEIKSQEDLKLIATLEKEIQEIKNKFEQENSPLFDRIASKSALTQELISRIESCKTEINSLRTLLVQNTQEYDSKLVALRSQKQQLKHRLSLKSKALENLQRELSDQQQQQKESSGIVEIANPVSKFSSNAVVVSARPTSAPPTRNNRGRPGNFRRGRAGELLEMDDDDNDEEDELEEELHAYQDLEALDRRLADHGHISAKLQPLYLPPPSLQVTTTTTTKLRKQQLPPPPIQQPQPHLPSHQHPRIITERSPPLSPSSPIFSASSASSATSSPSLRPSRTAPKSAAIAASLNKVPPELMEKIVFLLQGSILFKRKQGTLSAKRVFLSQEMTRIEIKSLSKSKISEGFLKIEHLLRIEKSKTNPIQWRSSAATWGKKSKSAGSASSSSSSSSTTTSSNVFLSADQHPPSTDWLYQFSLVLRDTKQEFFCENEAECERWVEAISALINPINRQSIFYLRLNVKDLLLR